MKNTPKTILVFAAISLPFLVAFQPRTPNPTTPDRVWQDFLDVADYIKSIIGLAPSKTLAQIKVTVPLKKGQMVFCTDCANALVCVSTGTVIYSFANMQATNRTTVCN